MIASESAAACPSKSRTGRRVEAKHHLEAESDPLLFELHVQAKPSDLVGQHVEAGGGPGFEGVLALDHRLVDLGPTFDEVNHPQPRQAACASPVRRLRAGSTREVPRR